jgi:uncharacterized protein (TIGR01777 family)
MKKMIIAGGSGFLGQVLINYFKNKVDEIVVFSRYEKAPIDNIRFVQWDATNLDPWQDELEHADVLINLTGKSVDCRYNAANKAEILRSRIDSTRVLNQAVLACENPPKHFINSSTATIYQHSLHEPNDENGILGSDFSMNVAKAWEAAFFETETPHTLKTAIRTSIVLGKNGGALVPMKRITKLGLGGKQGSGQQMISWMHELDYARAIAFIIEKQLDGVVNVTAPHPVKNQEFMEEMRRGLQVRFGLNSQKFLLELGAVFMRTETELLLKSRFVMPRRLLNAGFTFEYPSIVNALNNLLR